MAISSFSLSGSQDKYICKSSANNMAIVPQCWSTSSSELMKIENKIGPGDDPCRTPDMQALYDEVSPPSPITACRCSLRKEGTSLSERPSNPSSRSQRSRTVWFNVSKAHLKSNNTSTVTRLLSMAWRISSLTFSNAVCGL
ncbi:hypothetical protein TKK_0000181 [Trichogramma kaykai]